MIVYNLACDQDHPFEGWFGSADDLVSQQARGLLSCPMCGSPAVKKMLSAPRLNLLSSKQLADGVSAEVSAEASAGTAITAPAAPASAETGSAETVSTSGTTSATTPQTLLAPQHAKLQEMIREIVANTEDVGHNFPEEARRIHYKEATARSIRGFASRKEAEALAEEGIAVAQLPFNVTPKNALN